MKTKAIVATLLIAAAASADARFAWPYPPKAVPPDEIGHWVVINGDACHDSAASELTTASLSGGEPDGLKASPTKGKMPHVAERSSQCRAQESRKRFHVL